MTKQTEKPPLVTKVKVFRDPYSEGWGWGFAEPDVECIARDVTHGSRAKARQACKDWCEPRGMRLKFTVNKKRQKRCPRLASEN